MDAEKIINRIEASATCAEAAGVAESCGWGSSIDVHFAGSAIAVCEKDFQRISRADRQAYGRLNGQCEKKYEKEEGTMYRSFAAYCRLSVAKTYSSAFGPVE